ncbi:MAG: Xaa-Pro dipeptidase, partial [Gammaproteobacteria bacterium]|nr:Xaa-Pro dipeptidase [Gammaproteobacteria bacterium]
QQISATGDLQPPPENYPSLRFTRPITQDMVLTVEPGVYFIPALLSNYQAEDRRFNWTLIESLKCYGGIRIEDNVRVLTTGVENLTRGAFAAIQSEAHK